MDDYRRIGIPLECVSEGTAYNADREQVREMRMAGADCKAITEQTGIPEEQIVSYCLQLGLPANGPCRLMQLSPEDEAWLRYQRGESADIKCPVCGGRLAQSLRGRKKRFCSQRCRDTWWNDRRLREREKHGRRTVCENCGEVFYAVNEKQGERRFCSRRCYFEARYGKRG